MRVGVLRLDEQEIEDMEDLSSISSGGMNIVLAHGPYVCLGAIDRYQRTSNIYSGILKLSQCCKY